MRYYISWLQNEYHVCEVFEIPRIVLSIRFSGFASYVSGKRGNNFDSPGYYPIPGNHGTSDRKFFSHIWISGKGIIFQFQERS